MKKSELQQIIREAIVNQFTKDASIEKLEQVMYTFKSDKAIVGKIKEVITLINSYN
jgi:hypothetical protein